MKIITTLSHGIIDYILGFLLITSPWICSFYEGGVESNVLIIFGIFSFMYSLITDYELGFSNFISMKTHLWLDFIGGSMILVSPWLLEFNDRVYLPHITFGIFEIIFALMTVHSDKIRSDRSLFSKFSGIYSV
jgi:hypothetical protein